MVLLLIAFRNRTGNNQRGTGIIDQHAIHLIHHRKMVFTLYHFIRRMHHVIAEIIKTELVIRTISDISLVCLSSLVTVWLMTIDTVNSESEPFENGAVPLRVTFGQ